MPFSTRTLFSLITIATILCRSVCAEDSSTVSSPIDSATSATEPPRNVYLADSPWPMSHRNPYNQASSPYAGPIQSSQAEPEMLPGEPVPITLALSSAYPDGRRAIWATTLRDVFKVDASAGKLEYIDRMERNQSLSEAISGAYSVLDLDGNYFVPKGFAIECYRDSVRGELSSPITKSGNFTIPAQWQGEKDAIVGINLTYDGWLAFVTRRGVVGCLSRDLKQAKYVRLPGSDEEPVEISNSIAVDESGGIFVTTDHSVYRVQWNVDSGLHIAWSVPYQTSGVRVPGRLGKGSGTTPTLMGFENQDKFVVIGDGQSLMHIVLIWREDVPADWKGLPGRHRRIAAEIPVTFGDPQAKRSTTEQSLTVRGNEIVAVSNLYGKLTPLMKRLAFRLLKRDAGHATIYRSNQPQVAPYGVQKFVWSPATRKLSSAWANPTISCPNGIPTMSESTGMLYCIGQRESHWTLEAIDWRTGESVFHRKLSRGSRNNSFYAATEIGINGSILTGTFGGMLRFGSPNEVEAKEIAEAKSAAIIHRANLD